jgi:hypothetical protein
VILAIEAAGILTDVREARLAFAVQNGRDIDIVRRVEIARLFTDIHFCVIQLEPPPTFLPHVVAEQGSSAVVAMRVNGPRCKHDIRLLSFDQFSEFLIAPGVDLRLSVDLPGENRVRFQNLARARSQLRQFELLQLA